MQLKSGAQIKPDQIQSFGLRCERVLALCSTPVSRLPTPYLPGVARMLSLLLFATLLPTHAQSPDDHFHGSSALFVEGKIQEASVEAEEGLRRHPGDPKLRTLAEHLRKMKDEQRGRQDGSRESGDGSENKEKGDPGEQPEDDKSREREPPRDGDDGGEGDEKRDERPAPRPGEMSEEEARRWLDSFADDEKKEQAERRKGVRQRAGMEQTW
jgi:hypothetical protein